MRDVGAMMNRRKKIVVILTVMVALTCIAATWFRSTAILFVSSDYLEVDGHPTELYAYPSGRYLFASEMRGSRTLFILDFAAERIGIPNAPLFVPTPFNFGIFDQSTLEGYPLIGASYMGSSNTVDGVQIYIGDTWVREFDQTGEVDKGMLRGKKLILKRKM